MQRHSFTALQHLNLGREDVESMAPCTPLQQGMISIAMESSKLVYFNDFHFEVSKDVDLKQLKTAWQTVVNKTQILRTRFISTPDGFLQVALRNSTCVIVDSSVSNDHELDKHLETLHIKWWKENRSSLAVTFQLAITRSPTKVVMSLFLMHALYDALSLPLILNNVVKEYQGVEKISYGVPFLKALPKGPLCTVDGAKEFWTSMLNDAQTPAFPSLNPGLHVDDILESLNFSLPEKYEDIRRKLNITHQAMIQASWCVVLREFLGEDVTFGTVVSGRHSFTGAETVIGPLFNTVPFILRFSPQEKWYTLAKRCHEFNVAALPFQHTPLRDILKWRNRRKQPLFDTLFVFQKVEDATTKDAEILWRQMPSGFHADYPLALEVQLNSHGDITCTIVAQGTVIDQQWASKLLERFKAALMNLLNDPQSSVVDVTATNGSEMVDKGIPRESLYLNGVEGFEWTRNACLLRKEIASLAGMEESEVDEHTTIFELGLDSIDAIKLSSRLKKASILLPVSRIMTSLTIPRMMRQIEDSGDQTHMINGNSTVKTLSLRLRVYLDRKGLVSDEVEEVLPTTALQEAMVAEMVNSQFKHYYNHDVLQIQPGTDIEQLKKAWETVAANSWILRTRFIEIDDPELDILFAQVVYRHITLPWHVTDLDADSPSDHLLQTLQKEASEAGEYYMPFRLTIAHCRKSSFLILTMSHALYDGWSIGLLHDDIRKAYHQGETKRAPNFSVLDDIIESKNRESANFWQNVLHGCQSSLILPRRLPNVSITNTINRSESLSKNALSSIQGFCKTNGVTIQALGIAVWASVLASRVHKLDILHGVVLSGRDDEDAQNAMFPTMNTVAVRTVLHGTRAATVKYVQEVMNNIRQYQHFPLRKALQQMETRGKDLFNTLFIYQKRANEDSNEPSVLYESVGGASAVDYPVCVEIEIVNDRLVWRTACQDDVLSKEESNQLLLELDKVLAAIIENPTGNILEFLPGGVSVCTLAPFNEGSASTTPHEAEHWGADEALPNGTVESWSKTDKEFRGVLSRVSKVPEETISKDLTIFHLGLDSISAIKVAALLRKAGIKLSVSEMMKAATIEKMARLVEARLDQPFDHPQVTAKDTIKQALSHVNYTELLRKASLQQGDVEEILPATAGQIYMMSVWQNSCGALFFGNFRYAIHGNVKDEVLRASWNSLVATNPILRTIFLGSMTKEYPFIQVVMKNVQADVTFVPQGVSLETFAAKAGNSSQPLVRLYAQREEESWHLLVNIHHALYDGVSLPLLMQQLQDILDETSSATRPPLPQFSEFIAQSVSANALQARQTFWSSYLQGAATKCKSLRQPSKATGKRIEIFEPNVLSTKWLEQHARREGVSVHALFLAAFAYIYADLTTPRTEENDTTGGNDESARTVVFGVYLANRSQPEEISRLAAPTVALVPLRVELNRRADATGLNDVAKRIQEDLREIGSIEHSAAGLWEIDEWCNVRIDAFVNFLRLPDIEDSPGAVSAVTVREDSNARLERRCQVVEYGARFVQPNELKENVVRESYLVSSTLGYS